jgi:aldehyde:ferredoxin oxidoreductase
MDKFLRVNMTTKELKTEAVPEKYAALGGRGLTSQFVLDEVPATCEPLGPFNKLIFAPGLLSGTNAPSSGRMSCGGKSPLTGGIKESNQVVFLPRSGPTWVKAVVIEVSGAGDLYLLNLLPPR